MQLKRLFTSLLVVILILSAAVFTAAAAEEESFEFAVELGSAANGDILVAKSGDTVEVSISIAKNPGASVISATLNYDSTLLAPVVVEGEEKYELNGELNYDPVNSTLPGSKVGVLFREGSVTYLSDASNKETYTDTGKVITLYFTVLESDGCVTSDLTVNGSAICFEDNKQNILNTVVNNGTTAVAVHSGNVTTKVQPATCEAAGYTTITCDSCNETTTVPGDPATGHNAVAMEDVAATCTQNGSTGGTKCSNCDTVLTEPTVVAATGHTEEIIPATDTHTEGKKCSVCGEILQEPQPIEGSSLTWLWILLVVVVVLGAGGAAVYFLVIKKKQ